MENEEIKTGNTQRLNELLKTPELGDELGPDETAMLSAGLSHPGDDAVDEIIREILSEEAAEAPAEEVTAPGEAELLPQEEDYLAYSDEEEAPDAAAPEEPPVRKRRPKMKKGYGLLGIPHVLATAVWVAIVLVIGVSLGRMIWVSAADVLAFGKEDKIVTVTIEGDDTIETISNKLKAAGLIRYPGLFQVYADLSNVVEENKIAPGTYNLNMIYDYMALVRAMNTYSSARESVEVMIPEGYSCAQIFKLLEEEGVCTVAELEEYAANGELDEYWFLEGVERGQKYCLEGFLFPDTYQFYLNDDPRRVLEKFLDDFDYRFTDLMWERLEELNVHLSEKLANRGYSEEEIAKEQVGIHEVIIVASLIEKESANDIESYTISSVLFNRLFDWDYPPFLNIDAALVYALDGKEPLTEADKLFDSPFNTYMYQGLVPHPIANPGLNSINAALTPEDTDYYFYALDPSLGEHHFSTTQSEHDNFLASLED